jgi:hypothetical protein
MKKMMCGGKAKKMAKGGMVAPCDTSIKTKGGGGIKQADMKKMGRNMAKVKAKA